MPDAVALTDLEVIQRFSLAVRGATAPREAVIAALESDLAWLRGTTPSAGATAPGTEAFQPPAKAVKAVKAVKAPARRAAAPRTRKAAADRGEA